MNLAGPDHRCGRLWKIAASLESDKAASVTIYIKHIELGASKKEKA